MLFTVFYLPPFSTSIVIKCTNNPCGLLVYFKLRGKKEVRKNENYSYKHHFCAGAFFLEVSFALFFYFIPFRELFSKKTMGSPYKELKMLKKNASLDFNGFQYMYFNCPLKELLISLGSLHNG